MGTLNIRGFEYVLQNESFSQTIYAQGEAPDGYPKVGDRVHLPDGLAYIVGIAKFTFGVGDNAQEQIIVRVVYCNRPGAIVDLDGPKFMDLWCRYAEHMDEWTDEEEQIVQDALDTVDRYLERTDE